MMRMRARLTLWIRTGPFKLEDGRCIAERNTVIANREGGNGADIVLHLMSEAFKFGGATHVGHNDFFPARQHSK